jgi:hypothetical protein
MKFVPYVFEKTLTLKIGEFFKEMHVEGLSYDVTVY